MNEWKANEWWREKQRKIGKEKTEKRVEKNWVIWKKEKDWNNDGRRNERKKDI